MAGGKTTFPESCYRLEQGGPVVGFAYVPEGRPSLARRISPRIAAGNSFVSCVVSKRIFMPGFIKPQLGTLKSKAPKGDQWLNEIKYDGYRVQAHVNNGRKKVYTPIVPQTLMSSRPNTAWATCASEQAFRNLLGGSSEQFPSLRC